MFTRNNTQWKLKTRAEKRERGASRRRDNSETPHVRDPTASGNLRPRRRKSEVVRLFREDRSGGTQGKGYATILKKAEERSKKNKDPPTHENS